MRKIVIKTAAIALAGVVGIFAIVIAIFSLTYPQGMARTCESFGWYSLASNYYSLAYNYSGDIEDICRSIDNGELAENNGKIIKYCEKLFADEKFDSFFVADEYRAHSYYITYASALYLEGRADDAVEVAKEELLKGINVPSALGALTVLVSEKEDAATAQKLLPLVPEGELTENQQKYYDTVKILLTNLGG